MDHTLEVVALWDSGSTEISVSKLICGTIDIKHLTLFGKASQILSVLLYSVENHEGFDAEVCFESKVII